MKKQDTLEAHIRVYMDKSEYYSECGEVKLFSEGVLSKEARERSKNIKEVFTGGFLENLVVSLSDSTSSYDVDNVSEQAISAVDGLVDSVTSEVGRALIGLSVMQLSIKTIEPNQNIRLHKGGVARNSFSWCEGISMRTLDKKYVTPVLRKYNLLRLNADGFMMTRSLAENYPYTSLYKAKLRGAREEWLQLVEELEEGDTTPVDTLKYLLSKLMNAASNFTDKVEELFTSLENNLDKISNKNIAFNFINSHIKDSDYGARLLEISMHALASIAVECGVYGYGELKPLTQMRSANKKHGNIGDIEVIVDNLILISWDAKYGKGNLREEIEEASEKVVHHGAVEKIGFVTTSTIERSDEFNARVAEIETLQDLIIEISTFSDWVDGIYEEILKMGTMTASEISKNWIGVYCSYLGQKRRDSAPIDEPCLQWVEELIIKMKEFD